MIDDNFRDNVPQTFITAAIDDNDTSITVDSATGYPDAPFPLFIGFDSTDYEIVRVTDKNGGATWDIERGQYGTTAKAHADDTIVRHGVPHSVIQSLNVLPPLPPYQKLGAIITPYAFWQGTDDPTPAERLNLIWMPFGQDYVNPFVGAFVQTAGTVGTGAEFHVVAYDANGDLVYDEIIDVTSTGKAEAQVTGTIKAGWYLVGWLPVGTWTVTPRMFVQPNPNYGPSRWNADGTEAWQKVSYTLDGQASVPASIDIQTFAYGGSYPPLPFISTDPTP